MISFEPRLVIAALASIAGAAATELGGPGVDCYTIWADAYKHYVPTYYETILHKETSRCYSTSTPVATVTSVGATVTETTTSTLTTYTGDGTRTVLASAGFTPLASVIAANGGLNLAVHKGSVEAQPTAPPEQSNINQLSRLARCRYHDECYPAEVNCIVHVRKVVTSTSVIQADETLTSTVIPSGVTATMTSTQTDTVGASAVATATIYEVCQANNVITSYSDTEEWIDAEFNGNIGLSPGTDGTDCCQKCVLMGASCQSSAYTDTLLGGNCVYFLAGGVDVYAAHVPVPKCDGTFSAGTAVYLGATLSNGEGSPINNYTFSDSNCGQLALLGVDL